MVNHATVCCMCGDVGFSGKLFRCERCLSRFQHTYCGNYYEETTSTEQTGICDWCRSEGHNIGKHVMHSRRSSTKEVVPSGGRSNYVSGERIKQANVSQEEISGKGKNLSGHSGTPSSSSKSSGRRYKLLKDVLC